MTRLQSFATVLIVLFVGLGTAMADMHERIDENCVWLFADSRPYGDKQSASAESPPDYQHNSQDIRHQNPNIANTPTTSRNTPGVSEKPKEREAPKVELYTTTWCPYCRMATDFFRRRGIQFTEYDIEKDKDAARRKRRLDKRGGVPLAVINGRLVFGFSKRAYEQALQ